MEASLSHKKLHSKFLKLLNFNLLAKTSEKRGQNQQKNFKLQSPFLICVILFKVSSWTVFEDNSITSIQTNTIIIH